MTARYEEARAEFIDRIANRGHDPRTVVNHMKLAYGPATGEELSVWFDNEGAVWVR